jgi:hypothetical protein
VITTFDLGNKIHDNQPHDKWIITFGKDETTVSIRFLLWKVLKTHSQREQQQQQHSITGSIVRR